MPSLFRKLLLLVAIASASSCGVKGPPLPPVADIPSRSDHLPPNVSGSPVPGAVR